MSYKEKPILKLYKYENNTFVLKAIIDDFMECSFERNLYQAGNFTISINYNIPNAQLFQRGLFVQFGNDPYDFGEIISISDAISSDGKGSQIRTITGYDVRYILKRRVIKNMNSNGLWVMTGKGETVLRNLINDQCGAGESETKRQLPIINNIPTIADVIGKEYSVSEQFSNLYEVCKTIATQSEIGWRLKFDNSSLTLTLECYEGENRAQTVQFSTSFDSLANGQFTDSSDSYTNAIYVGGKGQNDDRDIYEGEDGAPEGLDRYESWDNQSNMTTEDEYEAEALAMLTQYGQTITVSGNGLAKCPYIYKEEYDVGDIITLAFSGKSAIVQILSVTEHWAFGQYSISFSFGKPQNNIQDQLQLILRKIQTASEKSESTDSVRWYTIPNDSQMPKADVTYRTIGFIGNVGSGATFKLYLDNEKTGAKTYHIYFKQLAGAGKLTLTTGKEGASNLVLNAGTYVAIVYVDENGNVTSQGMTATNTVEAGNNQPVTSDGVNTITDELETEISGKQPLLTAGANIKIDNNVIEGTSDLPTDAVLHYSFDDLPDLPDGTAVYKKDNDFTDITDWAGSATKTINNGKLTLEGNAGSYAKYNIALSQNQIILIKGIAKVNSTEIMFSVRNNGASSDTILARMPTIAGQPVEIVVIVNANSNGFIFYSNYQWGIEISQIYIGDGSYSTPIIDNANGQWNATNNGGIAVQGVSGKGAYFLNAKYADIGNFNLAQNFAISLWINPDNSDTELNGEVLYVPNQIIIRNGASSSSVRKFALFIHIGGIWISYNISDILPSKKWTHIVFVKNDTVVNAYIDGVLSRSITLSSSTLDNNSIEKALLCKSWLSNTRPQSIDDILIFDRALTEKEVVALYNNKANTPKYYNLNNYKLPAPPTTDGSYTLNVTVSGGVPSYSWS